MATLTIKKLPEALHERLKRQAKQNRRSLNKEVIMLLEQALMPSSSSERMPDRFERHFGAVDLGHPTGTDNEQIDADLATAYSDPS